MTTKTCPEKKAAAAPGEKISPEKPFALHSRVVATREIREDSAIVPVGAVGTVVNIIRGGVGYDVEFTTPLHAVVAASRVELTPER